VSYVGDLVRIIERGDARGGSFAFRAVDDVWSLNKDGEPFREVLDMNLREVSLGVSFPAYASTALAVGPLCEAPRRSVALAERQLRIARAK
jgi:phage head maturation protease